MAIYYTCKQRKGTILVCDEVEGNHFLLYLPAPVHIIARRSAAHRPSSECH